MELKARRGIEGKGGSASTDNDDDDTREVSQQQQNTIFVFIYIPYAYMERQCTYGCVRVKDEPHKRTQRP